MSFLAAATFARFRLSLGKCYLRRFYKRNCLSLYFPLDAVEKYYTADDVTEDDEVKVQKDINSWPQRSQIMGHIWSSNSLNLKSIFMYPKCLKSC